MPGASALAAAAALRGGRFSAAAAKLDAAIATHHALVIDGDALHLLDGARMKALAKRKGCAVLTPHAGEFKAAFGDYDGSKIEATRRAAAKAAATVVFKGPDTVIATPAGDVGGAPEASSWLSTAGTGDVLAGAGGAMLAAGKGPAAAVWLQAEATQRLGGAFIADDLMRELTAVRGSLCATTRSFESRRAATASPPMAATRRSRHRATRSPPTGRSHRTHIIKCRHAVTSPNAAGASSSISTMPAMRGSSPIASPGRSPRTTSRPPSARRSCRRPTRAAARRCMRSRANGSGSAPRRALPSSTCANATFSRRNCLRWSHRYASCSRGSDSGVAATSR